jgi:hypothetical protein
MIPVGTGTEGFHGIGTNVFDGYYRRWFPWVSVETVGFHEYWRKWLRGL